MALPLHGIFLSIIKTVFISERDREKRKSIKMDTRKKTLSLYCFPLIMRH